MRHVFGIVSPTMIYILKNHLPSEVEGHQQEQMGKKAFQTLLRTVVPHLVTTYINRGRPLPKTFTHKGMRMKLNPPPDTRKRMRGQTTVLTLTQRDLEIFENLENSRYIEVRA